MNIFCHDSVKNKNSDIVVKKHLFLGDSQKVEFIFKKKLYSFSTNLIGKIQIKNILMAILAAKNSKYCDKIFLSTDDEEIGGT